jgi:hypothetical protein
MNEGPFSGGCREIVNDRKWVVDSGREEWAIHPVIQSEQLPFGSWAETFPDT